MCVSDVLDLIETMNQNSVLAGTDDHKWVASLNDEGLLFSTLAAIFGFDNSIATKDAFLQSLNAKNPENKVPGGS